MPEIALYARQDGLFEPRHPKAVDIVKQNAGKMFLVQINEDYRTALSNRYLNGWVYTKQICAKLNDAGIMNPVGAIWTRDVIHAVMQNIFLVKEEFIHNSQHVKIYESTRDMSRKRFSEYINDQIKPFVSSMWNIEIEDPREGIFLEIYREIMER